MTMAGPLDLIAAARQRHLAPELLVSIGGWWFRDGKVVLVRRFDTLEDAVRHTEAPVP